MENGPLEHNSKTQILCVFIKWIQILDLLVIETKRKESWKQGRHMDEIKLTYVMVLIIVQKLENKTAHDLQQIH